MPLGDFFKLSIDCNKFQQERKPIQRTHKNFYSNMLNPIRIFFASISGIEKYSFYTAAVEIEFLHENFES